MSYTHIAQLLWFYFLTMSVTTTKTGCHNLTALYESLDWRETKWTMGLREMAQQSKALTALPGDLGSISTTQWQLNTTCQLQFQESSDLHTYHTYTWCPDIHMGKTLTYIKEISKNYIQIFVTFPYNDTVILVKKIYYSFLLLCMHACISVSSSHVNKSTRKPEGIKYPETRVTSGCELLHDDVNYLT